MEFSFLLLLMYRTANQESQCIFSFKIWMKNFLNFLENTNKIKLLAGKFLQISQILLFVIISL